MKINPWAAKPVESSMLVNVPKLVTAYYTNIPDPSVSEQRIAFGTSGRRGFALKSSFNEWHIRDLLSIPEPAKMAQRCCGW